MKHIKALAQRTGANPTASIDLAGMAVAMLLTVLVYFAGVQPMLDHRHHLQVQQRTLEEERERAEDLSLTVRQLRSHVQATRRAVDRHPLRLASLRALNERLSQMTSLGTDSGLRIERIQPGGRVAGDHYHTVPITLAGNGAFAASTQFLHRLHESFPDVAIASLSLAGRPERARSSDPPSFELTLLWYAAPPAKENEDRG